MCVCVCGILAGKTLAQDLHFANAFIHPDRGRGRGQVGRVICLYAFPKQQQQQQQKKYSKLLDPSIQMPLSLSLCVKWKYPARVGCDG